MLLTIVLIIFQIAILIQVISNQIISLTGLLALVINSSNNRRSISIFVALNNLYNRLKKATLNLNNNNINNPNNSNLNSNKVMLKQPIYWIYEQYSLYINT